MQTFKFHMTTIDNDFARMFEIDRNATPYDRLHLPNAPFRLARVAHQISGLQKDDHCKISRTIKDTPL